MDSLSSSLTTVADIHRQRLAAEARQYLKQCAYCAAADELYSAVVEPIRCGGSASDRLREAVERFAAASNDWEDHPLKRKP